MPISQYILNEELKPQIQDDLQELSINGVYNAANADGSFGESLDGIKTVLTKIVADADHPAFQIPLTALTDTNIVDQVTAYDRAIPEKMKSKVKKIFMSHSNKERYILDFQEKYGDNKYAADSMKTYLGGRDIVGLPNLSTDVIFSTVDRNMIKLIDKIDNPPKVTSVQVLDYTVKLFMEFWLGYDFWINELVFVSNYTDTTYGIGSTANNQLYFGIDGVTP